VYLFCLCLFTYSGVQHILCICFLCVCLRIVVSNTYCVFVFVLFVFVLCILCFQCLWIVYFWLHHRYSLTFIKPPLIERGLFCNHLVCPSVRLSGRSHFRNIYLSFYWKKWFYIWYMALACWLVPCLPFPGLLHIYFLFIVWLKNFSCFYGIFW
jgi:hypothetical protein